MCNVHYARWYRTGDTKLVDPGKRVCLVPLCGLTVTARKRCGTHYQELLDSLPRCSVTGCEKPIKARRLCAMHYGRFNKSGVIGPPDPIRQWRTGKCAVDGCGRSQYAREFCNMHHQRLRDSGSVGGARSTRRHVWPGDSFLLDTGYVKVYRPDHPRAWRSGWMMQHRLVMEQMAGRPLESFEEVHHRNGVRHDKRPENLELWDTSQPAGQRVMDKMRYYVALAMRTAAIHGADVVSPEERAEIADGLRAALDAMPSERPEAATLRVIYPWVSI